MGVAAWEFSAGYVVFPTEKHAYISFRLFTVYRTSPEHGVALTGPVRARAPPFCKQNIAGWSRSNYLKVGKSRAVRVNTEGGKGVEDPRRHRKPGFSNSRIKFLGEGG